MTLVNEYSADDDAEATFDKANGDDAELSVLRAVPCPNAVFVLSRKVENETEPVPEFQLPVNCVSQLLTPTGCARSVSVRLTFSVPPEAPAMSTDDRSSEGSVVDVPVLIVIEKVP